MISFHRKELIEKYGTWARVQIEFHDFLLSAAGKSMIDEWSPAKQATYAKGEGMGHAEFFDKTVIELDKMFETQENAWAAFLEHEGLKP
jgi:hypothetical protein